MAHYVTLIINTVWDTSAVIADNAQSHYADHVIEIMNDATGISYRDMSNIDVTYELIDDDVCASFVDAYLAFYNKCQLNFEYDLYPDNEDNPKITDAHMLVDGNQLHPFGSVLFPFGSDAYNIDCKQDVDTYLRLIQEHRCLFGIYIRDIESIRFVIH